MGRCCDARLVLLTSGLVRSVLVVLKLHSSVNTRHDMPALFRIVSYPVGHNSAMLLRDEKNSHE